jgi:hypothetical protein
MVYDLNLILLLARANGGELCAAPQRAVLSIMDGLIAGEGNGPLQPLPVKADALLASRNPFLIDFAMAKLMGFDVRKIRLVDRYRRFPYAPFAAFEPEHFGVTLNGVRSETGLDALPVIHRFVPSPGWKGHIELV